LLPFVDIKIFTICAFSASDIMWERVEDATSEEAQEPFICPLNNFFCDIAIQV